MHICIAIFDVLYRCVSREYLLGFTRLWYAVWIYMIFRGNVNVIPIYIVMVLYTYNLSCSMDYKVYNPFMVYLARAHFYVIHCARRTIRNTARDIRNEFHRAATL